MLGVLSTARQKWQSSRSEPPRSARALAWIRANRLPSGGIVPYAGCSQATQEVTWYLIPTLRRHGEHDLARALAQWVISEQRDDGAFCAVDGVPYTFDTAQVVRGLLTMLDDIPEAEARVRRACDYLVSQIDDDGRVRTPSYNQWVCADGSTFSAYTDLYVLPPLVAAGERLGDGRYLAAAERALQRFTRQPDLTEWKPQLGMISHVFGYMMEALAELGERRLALEGLAQAAALQRPTGAIPAYPGASWVCSTGLAQLALAWYRLGERGPADKAVRYLESLQNPSGGFYGGYGPGAAYFPHQEISWAVKFYLDCIAWQTERH
jgi:malonyl-CoA O-methyltransferase